MNRSMRDRSAVPHFVEGYAMRSTARNVAYEQASP